MNDDPALPGPDFDGVQVGKRLLRVIRAGALATLGEEAGFPFASLVTVATDLDGSPLFLMSRLAAHTRNLDQDGRASVLLVEGGKGDPLAHPRLTVTGVVRRASEARIRSRFLARHPKAKLYADFADFSFWRMEVVGAHLNGGFARAMSLTPRQILADLSGAEGLIEAGEGAVAHMNEVHRDALGLYATKLAEAPPGDWRTTGVDPEGIDLAAGDLTARVEFDRRVDTPGDLRKILRELAEGARNLPA